MKTSQTCNVVKDEIRKAFRGVTLGGGISLRQAQVIDGFQAVAANKLSGSPAKAEITNDWSQLSLDELERDCIAHLDALGFRYYIPALMLSVLDHYESTSMRVIGTLGGLHPKKDNSWDYHLNRYSLLSSEQKAAIAQFLVALPTLVELQPEDQKVVSRAVRNYWGEYLQATASE